MTTRANYLTFNKIAPGAASGLQAMNDAVKASGLEADLVELVKLRASQLNGCAYCLQYHLTMARKLGVDSHKLDLLAAWHDAGVYSEREKTALTWTELLTHIAPDGVPDEDYEDAKAQFSDEEIVFLTVTIATINAWNRIGVALQFPPSIPKA